MPATRGPKIADRSRVERPPGARRWWDDHEGRTGMSSGGKVGKDLAPRGAWGAAQGGPPIGGGTVDQPPSRPHGTGTPASRPKRLRKDGFRVAEPGARGGAPDAPDRQPGRSGQRPSAGHDERVEIDPRMARRTGEHDPNRVGAALQDLAVEDPPRAGHARVGVQRAGEDVVDVDPGDTTGRTDRSQDGDPPSR